MEAAGSDPTPVRVLWLAKGLGVGGLERILCWWAEHRDPATLDARVAFVLDELDNLASVLTGFGVPVTNLGARNEFDLRWPARLRRLLIDEPVDIVHAQSPYAAAFARLVVRSLPRRRRPRLVCTDHNVWSDFRLATRVVHRVTCPLDDAHFAVSPTVRQSVPARLRARVEVLIPGIPVDEVRGRTGDRRRVREELGVTGSGIVVITLANFRPAKRYDDLAHAAKLVIDAGVDAVFVAVGEGPLQWEILQLVAELGITDRFRLLGLREDAAPLLAGADIFVLASDHEGGPLAVLEAMAAGLPVVSTSVGLVPDAISEGVNGHIVPIGSREELAAAIIDLARDPDLRRRMGAAGGERVDRFDVTRSLRELEGRYRALAGSSG
jgi:glycosyltransferase involved in cell wall biosynthesis